MRKLLLSAVAAGPLLVLAAGAPAFADTTLSGATTSPVATSTANNGQPDNVIVASGASVTVSGPVAVTLDSSNTVTNNGSINIKDQDNSVSVLLKGGHTGALTNAGVITNNETYTRTDTNSDGVLDGAYAKGVNRYGVHLIGPGALVGAITLQSGSSITVQGNNSFGVALDAPLTGNLLAGGSITTVGDNSTALSVAGGASGNVQISGALNATGGGAVGANITGDIGGSLRLYSAIQSTGYSAVTRSPNPAANSALLPSNLLISGSGLQIGANVAGGVFVGAPPTGTVASDATTDADADGIVDSVEGTGSVTTLGTAPAVLIGAGGRDVHLGAFGAGANAYGLIVEGGVVGNGLFDGHSGAGMQIGIAGGAVHIDGGLSVTGTGRIDGVGFQDNATGLHVLSGVTIPALVNAGSIDAESTSATASQATGLSVEAGAVLPSIVNRGAISASVTGDLASAAAIVDRSGALSSVTNTNTISAAITPAVSGDATSGKTVALDLSANTSGVTLVQNANAAASITPKIVGDILLGSGDDVVQFNAGTVKGALDFGGGTGSLLIDNGASYAGKLMSSGPAGALAININNGVLEDDSTSNINASSLTVGPKGQLTFTADPAAGAASRFTVTGPATIANGGTLALRLQSLLTTPQSYVVVSSPALTVGTSASLTASTPYLFVASFNPDTAAGTITLNLRRRLASEAGLNRAETAAWDPVYQNLALNPGIERAFLAQTDAAGYRSMLNQLLPDYAGGVFRALSWASEQQGVAAGEPTLGEDQQGPTRAWTQEIVLSESKKTDQTAPYDILGVGVVAGLESVSPSGSALGMKIGFVTANIRNPDAPGDNLLGVSQLNGGVYWRGDFGGLRADAQVGAGFIWANDRREFLFTDSVGSVRQTARSSWSGYSLSARAGLQYTATMGSFFLQPRVHADYFRLHQSGYSETGRGTGFDMKVAARDGNLFSVTGSVIAGMTFGDVGFRWRPQIEAGYRAVVSGSAGDTTTQFIGGNDPFTLAAETVKTNSAIGRVGVHFYSGYLDFLLDGGVAYSKDYTDVDVHMTARTIF